MRTRHLSMESYKMNDNDYTVLKRKCATAGAALEKVMFAAAKESNPDIADALFIALRNNLSYDKLCCKMYVPIGKDDFYGYLRRTMFLIKEKILHDDESVQEYFKEQGYARRYCKIKDAAAELIISEYSLLKMAKKAGALIKFGSLTRIDMNKLYEYIDSECVKK